MATEYINDGGIIIEYHGNYVNDKFNTFTIYENEQNGWECNLSQEDAVKLARFLKKYVEVKL